MFIRVVLRPRDVDLKTRLFYPASSAFAFVDDPAAVQLFCTSNRNVPATVGGWLWSWQSTVCDLGTLVRLGF